MTMEIVVDYPWKKTFVLTALVKVNHITQNQTAHKNLLNNDDFPLVFTCKNDKDCYGNGYCKARICECLPNYEYALDCSHYGCKYIDKFQLVPCGSK